MFLYKKISIKFLNLLFYLIRSTKLTNLGRLRILYYILERLNNKSFIKSIKFVPRGIYLVAINKVYYISK